MSVKSERFKATNRRVESGRKNVLTGKEHDTTSFTDPSFGLISIPSRVKKEKESLLR